MGLRPHRQQPCGEAGTRWPRFPKTFSLHFTHPQKAPSLHLTSAEPPPLHLALQDFSPCLSPKESPPACPPFIPPGKDTRPLPHPLRTPPTSTDPPSSSRRSKDAPPFSPHLPARAHQRTTQSAFHRGRAAAHGKTKGPRRRGTVSGPLPRRARGGPFIPFRSSPPLCHRGRRSAASPSVTTTNGEQGWGAELGGTYAATVAGMARRVRRDTSTARATALDRSPPNTASFGNDTARMRGTMNRNRPAAGKDAASRRHPHPPPAPLLPTRIRHAGRGAPTPTPTPTTAVDREGGGQRL